MSTLTHNFAIRDPAAADAAMPDAGAPGAATRELDRPHASATAVPPEAPRIYRGRSLEQLIPKIVAELGEDAIVIRHDKGLTGGFAGFFRRPFVEIEAERGDGGSRWIDRYDDDDGASALPEAPEEGAASPPADTFAAELASAETAEPVVVEDLHAATALSANLHAATTPPEDLHAATTPPEDLHAAAAPPEDLHAATTPPDDLHAAAAPEEELLAMAQRELPVPAVPSNALPDATPISISSGPARDAIERTLLGFGVDEQLVREVIQAAAAHVLPLLASASGPALAQAVRRALQQRIPVCSPLPPGSATIALVGPGGSGKSACCAAMLDAYHRRSTIPVACATILSGPTHSAPGKLYVTLGSQLPQPVALDDPSAVQALHSAREEGLLLLDTPPLSPAEDTSIRALAAALQPLAPDRVVLALPATLGAKPVARLLEAYRPLGTSALAITHADETDQLGVAVQVACALGLAPAYLLEGNGSGWGLAQIDPADLADRLLPPP